MKNNVIDINKHSREKINKEEIKLLLNLDFLLQKRRRKYLNKFIDLYNKENPKNEAVFFNKFCLENNIGFIDYAWLYNKIPLGFLPKNNRKES